MKVVLIAGGTGMIGRKLTNKLTKNGYQVYKLTRRAKKRGQIYWDPNIKTIEGKHLNKVEAIINLAGENIGEMKWSESRKEKLRSSRIESTKFLYSCTKNMPKLAYYIGASGINCYGNSSEKLKSEKSSFGKDFLSNLVKEWEESSRLFSEKVPVSILRIAGVLDKNGGMLKKIKTPIKFGMGSPLGNGKQYLPWVHIDDLVDLIIFCLDKKLEGTYNAVASCDKNKDFMKMLSMAMRRPYFMPRIPSWIIKLVFGERSILMLGSVNASNEKILSRGFDFKFKTLPAAFRNIFRNNSNI